MPIHHAVLALLADGPSHGYELKSRFQEAIGPQWGELNIGHLHQVVERLQRDGLVTGRLVTQADRPDKTVYRLTRAGRLELERWLETPFVRESGYRDDFFLKLFAASRLGPDRLRSVIETQRVACLKELAALGRLRSEHSKNPLVSLLIQAAIFQTEANLKTAQAAEQQIPRLSSGPEPVESADRETERRAQTTRRPRAATP